MTDIYSFIHEQLAANQFLTGGFVLGILGCIVAACRKMPGKIWTWIKCRIVIEVDIQGHDAAFGWLNFWLSKQEYSRDRARLLTVTTQRPDRKSSALEVSVGPESVGPESPRPEIIFSPAPGNHYLFYRRRFVILHRERKDNAESGKALFMPIESFNVKVFTRDRSVVRGLLEEAREMVHPKGEKRLTILSPRYGDWVTTGKRRLRPMESVILRTGLMEELVTAIDTFRAGEDWYIQRGIPWRLGILLSGPPGSGKSSSVMAIASHFGMDIAPLNLSRKGLDDEDLCSFLATVPHNAILLLEDVDCVFNQREASGDKENAMTFSGLLNAIDGVAASEGRVMVMTTNHPEKLDPALIRPGRADIRREIGHPDENQIIRIFDRFYPDATPAQGLAFVEGVGRTSMAALQGHMMRYSDVAEAVKHARELSV